MSHENVEVVRQAIEAFSRRDLDAAVGYADPAVEVDWSKSEGVQAGIYRGVDETRRFWSTFLDTFERIEVVPDNFIENGDDVIVEDRSRMWGRDGIEVTARNVAVVTLRGGCIITWRLCRDRAEALKAVGLEE